MTGSGRISDAGERLSAAETRALAALLAGADQESAAKAAGRTPRTLRRWLQTERFQSARATASREILTAATQVLQAGTERAATALVAMAGGALPPTSARVMACRATLELARDAGEVDELRSLVEDLSEKIAALATRGRGGVQ